MAASTVVVPNERILSRIFVIREVKVLLDSDLAVLYGLGTKVLVQAVKRNIDRFPSDFMFQLSKTEIENLKSQSVTSSSWGGRRTAPYAFTEHGVAMLSSVLKSPRAVVVNIDIMRAFVQLRRMAAEHGDLTRRLDELEKRFDSNFQAVFEAIRALIVVETSPKQRVGYLKANEKT